MNWQLLYSGCINTPFLWEGSLDGLKQFELEEINTPQISNSLPPSLRLGSLCEFFTFEYWKNVPGIKILSHNLQIESATQTLGELDAILEYRSTIYHVEIAYKFYLYDSTHGDTPLERWVGPNRNDNLVTKLDRLKSHQLPLIETKEALDAISSHISESSGIASRVWIKGQLFLPHGSESIPTSPLNSSCISGFYTRLQGLSLFEDAKFHIPTKQQWFAQPFTDVKWRKLDEICSQVEPLLERNYSPLLWMKRPNGELEKLFVIWW